MGCFSGHWVTIDGHPVYIEADCRKQTLAAAATIVLSALAGGGVAGATSAGGALAESGIPRTTPRSPSQPRTGITDITSDTVRATTRLQNAGRYRATAQTSFDDSACAAHSYGEIHQFFATHRCRALYRGFVDIRDKNYVILISIATVYMPDPASTSGLHRLLFDSDNGGITSLSQERGRYRQVSFAHAPTWWSRGEMTLTIVQGQPVGRTPGDVVLDKLLRYYLDNLS